MFGGSKVQKPYHARMNGFLTSAHFSTKNDCFSVFSFDPGIIIRKITEKVYTEPVKIRK